MTSPPQTPLFLILTLLLSATATATAASTATSTATSTAYVASTATSTATSTSTSTANETCPAYPGPTETCSTATKLTPERRETYAGGRILDITHRITPTMPSFGTKYGLGQFLWLVTSQKNGSMTNGSEFKLPSHILGPMLILQLIFLMSILMLVLMLIRLTLMFLMVLILGMKSWEQKKELK